MKPVFIFGAPRSGKSTIANTVAKVFGYQVISEDALREAFALTFPDVNINNVTAWHSDEFHLFLQHYLEQNMEYSHGTFGYIIEGSDTDVEMAIKYFSKFNGMMYFVGQCELTPAEFLGYIRAKDTAHDWSAKVSDEEMLTKIRDYIEESRTHKEGCDRYKIPYYETVTGREATTKEILEDIKKRKDL